MASTGATNQCQFSKTESEEITALPPIRYDAHEVLRRNKRDRSPTKYGILLLDTWFPEILAFIFSCSCFIAVTIVLHLYDNQLPPNPPRSLSLNAIISILSTVARSSLLVVVAGCIGQLKYIWFSKGRHQLQSLQAIDDASRGPRGSLLLLFDKPRRSLISLGAVITILALAFEPFMQQIISYPVRQSSHSSESALARQSRVLLLDNKDGSFQDAVDLGFLMSDFQETPTCPSGNCTWPSYQSVGFCTRCNDVTPQAILEGCDNTATSFATDDTVTACNITLPYGEPSEGAVIISPLERGSDAIMSLPTNLVWLASILGQSLSTSINRPAPLTNELVAVAHAELSIDLENSETYENPSTGLRINRVTRCIMSFCSRELNVTITNGILAEKILNRDWGEIFTHEYEANGRTTQIPCWKPSDSKFVHLKRTPGDPEYTQFPDESQFSFCPDLNPYLGLENVFFASMYENWQRVDDRSPPWSFLGSDINPPRILKDGLEHITTRVAASLTKYALNRSDHTVIGTMGLPEVYVAVEWRWLIFPAFLLVSTITLLVSTIWVNNAAGLPLWKFSVLPLLYHGLAAYHIPRIPPNGLGAVSALDSLAHETEVRLDRYGTPERYVLR